VTYDLTGQRTGRKSSLGIDERVERESCGRGSNGSSVERTDSITQRSARRESASTSSGRWIHRQ